MSEIDRLVVAWVSAQQRHFSNSTRGIATVEQRMAWEQEAKQIIAAHDAEVRADERRRVLDLLPLPDEDARSGMIHARALIAAPQPEGTLNKAGFSIDPY